MNDTELLEAVLELDHLSDKVRTIFDDMLFRLGKWGKPLTEGQREWAEALLEWKQYEPVKYGPLLSEGGIPRGKEVPTPTVLQNRPLKPPGRK